MNLLMLDLDGTVREPRSGSEFINDPTDQRVIAAAAEKIAMFREAGYRIVGITNQGGVEAGFKSIDDCHHEQLITLLLAKLDAVYYCPDKGDTCFRRTTEGVKTYKGEGYRKPKPGMLHLAVMEQLDFVDKTEADILIYVGDRPEDRQAAKKAQVQFYTEKQWWSLKETPALQPA